MIVPFEPIMFRTQIGKEIGEASGVDYNQLSGNFRRGLDNVLFIETNRRFDVVRMILEEPQIQKDLYAIYGASRPEYRTLPKTSPEKGKTKKQKKQEPNKQIADGRSRISDGQVVSEAHMTEKFMARIFRDKKIFDRMYNQYETMVYLFVNQLEIRPTPNLDYRAFEAGEFQREILVHYSIYSDGFEIHSGVARQGFSSTVNEQKQIILENFPGLASQIVSRLPVVHLSGDK